MIQLPKQLEAELRRLIEERLPAEQIAFMLRLDRDFVESEIQRLNTTNPPAKDR